MAIDDNPFQEKIKLNQFSGLDKITGVFGMEEKSESTLVIRRTGNIQSVYEFKYEQS